VVNVSHCATVLPTWDLTVEDCHEYVAGGILVHNTFTDVMEDARDKGLPIYSWCWRELLEPHGWMTRRFIETKRNTVSAQMWHTEYDLNEPSAGSRAVDLDKVELYFQRPEVYGEPLEVLHKGNGDHDEYLWATYDPAGVYAVGADWAKERDKTVIAVIRYDTTPRTMVKLIRINRRPWPEMIELFNKTKVAYRAVGEHDKTGLGSVVNDYLIESDTVRGFVMVGRPRTKLLLDYITSFEHGEYRLPVIPIDLNHQGVTVNPLYRAHRSTTVADVYAPGKWDSHLPDDFAAMALAHRAAERIPQPTTEDSLVPLDLGAREVDKVFATQSVESVTLIGDVQVVDERYPGGVSEFVISGDGGRDIWEAMEL
jgi:hypothetical protein